MLAGDGLAEKDVPRLDVAMNDGLPVGSALIRSVIPCMEKSERLCQLDVYMPDKAFRNLHAMSLMVSSDQVRQISSRTILKPEDSLTWRIREVV